MSEVPMEYKVLKKKFSMSLQKSLKDDLKAILVFGGVAANKVYSGVSDIDFMIIIDHIKNLKSFSETINKLGQEILSMVENPLFASLLDYEIYTLDQLPDANGMNGFSAIKALALKESEVLFGENYFDSLNIDKENLKSSALLMVHEYLSKLIAYNLSPKFDPLFEEEDENMYADDLSEEIFLAVDAVLLSAQAYHMIKNNKYISMPDVVLFGETEKIEGVDNSLIVDIGYLRQGVENKVENVVKRSIDFCGQIIDTLSKLWYIVLLYNKSLKREKI